jgi:guanylate kinase
MANIRITKAVFVSPTGGGKSVVISRLLEKGGERCIFSVSCTTRTQGEEEVEGKDYFFISKKEFRRRIKEGYFFEHENINGDYYGIPLYQLKEAEEQKKVLVFDVDIKGALKLKKKFPGNDFAMFFIDSGDDEKVYEKRIRSRNRKSDTEEKIKKRLDRIPMELKDGRLNADVIVYNRGSLEEYQRLIDDMIIRKLFGLRDALEEVKVKLHRE